MRKPTIGLLFLFTTAFVNFHPAFGQEVDSTAETPQEFSGHTKPLDPIGTFQRLRAFYDSQETSPDLNTEENASPSLPPLDAVKEDGNVESEGAPTIKIYKPKHASAPDVQRALHDLFPDVVRSSAADLRANSLIIQAEPEFHKIVDALLAAIDKKAGDATEATIEQPRKSPYIGETRPSVDVDSELSCTMYELKYIGNREASAKLNKLVAENKFLKGAGTKIIQYPGDEKTLVFWAVDDMKPILEVFIAQIDEAAKPAEDPEAKEDTAPEDVAEVASDATEKPAAAEKTKPDTTAIDIDTESPNKPRLRTPASEQIAANISAIFKKRIDDLEKNYTNVDTAVKEGESGRIDLLSAKLALFRAKEDLYRWGILRANTNPEVVRNRIELRKILDEQLGTAEEYVKIMLDTIAGDENSPLIPEMLSGQSLVEDIRIKQFELDLEEAETE